MRTILHAALAAAALLTSAPMAEATSGPGCLFVVNVDPGDALNMRSRPAFRSAVVDRLVPGSHGILHLDGTCVPLSRAWGSRWCPISHYDADRVTKGWVKARYVRDSDCP